MIARIAAALAFGWLGIAVGFAADNAYERQLASEIAEVETTEGRTFQGRLDGLRDGRLYLRLATDGGEVTYSFPADEIERFDIPGDELTTLGAEALERGDLDTALPILDAVGRQRSRYLALLDADQRKPVSLLIRATDAAGDDIATIGFARIFQPFATTSEEQSLVRDSLLKAHANLGMADEVQRLAGEWCRDSEIPPYSALGWYLLAKLQFEKGDYEAARWVSLQPVTFSGLNETPFLGESYAYAIASCHALGDTVHARLLFDEMQLIELVWPSDPKLEAVGRLYAGGNEKSAVPNDLQFFSPNEDRNLSIHEARRLVGSQRP